MSRRRKADGNARRGIEGLLEDEIVRMTARLHAAAAQADTAGALDAALAFAGISARLGLALGAFNGACRMRTVVDRDGPPPPPSKI